MPGVVRLLDYVETRDSYYIVMETQTRTIDLFDFISAAGTLPEDVAREIFGQVSCDWRRPGHVTTILTSDWPAGGGGCAAVSRPPRPPRRRQGREHPDGPGHGDREAHRLWQRELGPRVLCILGVPRAVHRVRGDQGVRSSRVAPAQTVLRWGLETSKSSYLPTHRKKSIISHCEPLTD